MNSAAEIKSKKKNRIFIVDDHQILRQGLLQLINQEEDMIAVGDTGTAAEAILGIKESNADLVIVDISLEGMSGLELTKNLLEANPKQLVLILSMYDEAIYMERIFRAGARGYLNKREASEHIAPAIRKILAGDIYVSDKWKEKLMHRFVGGQSKVTESPLDASLSDRELEVLHLVGQGYSTRHVAEALHLSIKTVDSHYANIKEKLDLKNLHELIEYAVKQCLSEK